MPKAEATGEKKETPSAGEFHLKEPSPFSPTTSFYDMNRDDSDQKYTIQAAGSSSSTAEVLPVAARPVKRGRGRPKGNKNNKAWANPAGESSSAPPRKRGRPPKVPTRS
jgi:hypothetical protein